MTQVPQACLTFTGTSSMLSIFAWSSYSGKMQPLKPQNIELIRSLHLRKQSIFKEILHKCFHYHWSWFFNVHPCSALAVLLSDRSSPASWHHNLWQRKMKSFRRPWSLNCLNRPTAVLNSPGALLNRRLRQIGALIGLSWRPVCF